MSEGPNNLAERRPRWLLKQKSILDEPADVLICSANVHLTLSGGVGADLLARYGNAMQQALEKVVRMRTPHCVERGDVIPYSGPEVPYRMILHAVAVDGWYDSTSTVITETVRKALQMAAQAGAEKVALTALATGFGHLTLAQFADGLRPVMSQDLSPVVEVAICLLLDFQVAELARCLPEIARISETEPQTN